MLGVPTCITIDNDAAAIVVQEAGGKPLQNSKRLDLEGDVRLWLPVNILLSCKVLNDSTIFWLPPGFKAGVCAEPAIVGHVSRLCIGVARQLIQQRYLVEFWDWRVKDKISAVDTDLVDVFYVQLHGRAETIQQSFDLHYQIKDI